jgi:GNAT superfamily N-acetyltransferase
MPLVDLSVRQFSGAWRLMCANGPRPESAVEDDVEYIFSGSPIPFFNIALAGEVSSDAALTSCGQRACAWASARSVPWLFVVTHERVPAGADAVAALDRCGLTPMLPLTGMVAGQVAPGARVPRDLELTRPADDAACAAILDVNGLAYGADLEAGKDLIGTTSFWADHFPAVGRAAATPVSCAAVLMVDGCRYVALVATDPGHQRRGYAEAAMRHALELAADAHGSRPTVLHATEAGRPIYERMGYAPMSTHTMFIEKAFLEGH